MKGNVIQMNTLRLNSVRLNGIGKVQSVSLKGGSTEDPVFPPVEPPIEPEPTPTYTLSASVTNGKVSAKRNGSAVNLPYTANEGDTIVVSVTPNDGYAFEGWNDGNTDNPRTITMNADKVLSAQCVEVVVPPVGNYIRFEDAEVERVLMANGVSSDGVGITMEDAAAVTSISTWFKENKVITSFDELQYFTGLTSISTLYESGTSQAAFYGCDKLKRITIPKNVTRLGSYSFYLCSALESVSFADKSKITDINSSAFAQCTSLAMEVDFPNLQELGNYAFDHCEKVSKVISLGKITIINGAPEVYNANSTFYGCKSLQAVSLPSTLTKMGNLVFVQCAFSEVEIPADVTQMDSYVFYQCASLSKAICRAATPPSVGTEIFKGTNSALVIYVPDASLEAYKTALNWVSYADRIHPLSEIEGSPYIQFEDAEVERVLMAKGVSSDGIGITKADAENVTSIADWFKGNTTIQTFDELKYFTNVKAISSAYAFMGCTALQWVNFENIESINSQVFNNSGITELILPKVITIHNSGLVGMKKVTKVVIGASCTNIDANNIWNWNDKGNVSFIFEGATPPTFSTSNNKPDWYGVTFYVPDASVDAYKSAWSSWASRIKGISEYNG